LKDESEKMCKQAVVAYFKAHQKAKTNQITW